MMTSDFAASEFRRTRRALEGIKRRLATTDVPGKVVPGSQDYATRTLRLELGKSADGRPVLSPKVQWQQPGAGTFKVHAPPKDSEQMRLRSPSGAVGNGSLADWATYDDDNGPPSTSGDEAVMEFEGASKATFRKDLLQLEMGGAKITMTEGLISIDAPMVRINEGA